MTETTNSKMSIVEIKDITAGAGALGLLGYGMPGVLLGLANAGIIQAGSVILAMAIFMGGFARFTAGLMGNSGNSDIPHLHFQVVTDIPSFLGAEGYPHVYRAHSM